MSELLRVVLKRGRSKPFWLGHPWVFSGAVHRVDGEVGETGGFCVVIDERKNVLGSGFYNPHAQIAVRILEHRRTTDRTFEPRPFETVIRTRLGEAVARRRVLGLSNAETNVFRLVNSEGDGLPGLIVDRLDTALVVQLGSRGMYEMRDRIAEVLARTVECDRIWVTVNETASRLETIPVTGELHAGSGGQKNEGPVTVVENGVRYEVLVGAGQKTGFYADQRDNRKIFAGLCTDKTVLDAYSYVGGFGLNAMKAGAAAVTSLDSSGPAVRAARANAALNGFGKGYEAIETDAMVYLKEAQAQGRTWERIVIDPPKFARGRSHMKDALKKYARLNTLALGALAPGGLLMTCSCSQHVSRVDFVRMLTEAGHRLRMDVRIHGLYGQPHDHPFPVVAPEADYLKAALISATPSV